MAVTEAPATSWIAACRASGVVGAALWGAAGVGAALDQGDAAEPLRLAGIGLALCGWGAEAVLCGLSPAVVAGLVALPTVVAAGALAATRGATDAEAAVNAEAASMIALAAPFLAAAIRSLALQAASTWHVGVAGATLALCGGVAAASTGGVGPDAVSLLTVAGVLLVAYSASDRQNLGELASSRTVRFGAGSTVLVALAGAIAVGSYAVARRNDHTWDWTRQQRFTLSDQTGRVLDALPGDVEVKAFFRPRSPTREDFADLIGRMAQRSPRLHVTWIDPLANPMAAKESLVTGDHGVVVLSANGRERRLEGEIREEELTRELVLLSSEKDHQICWVMGHGEPDPDDDQLPEGFGGLRTELEASNYRFQLVRTAQEPIPTTCEVLVIARPAVDPLPYEREALAAFVASGGRALVLVDLYSRRNVLFDVPELVADLDRYGVHVGEDVVFDLNQKHRMLGSEDPTMVVLSGEDFGGHPVTRSLGAALVLPGARSVRFTAAEGLDGTELLRTSRDAWAETTPDDPNPDEGLEVVGEVPVMVVVEVKDPAALRVLPPAPPGSDGAAPTESPAGAEGGRPTAPAGADDAARGVPADFAPAAGGKLVVLGDTDFASNRYLTLGNNRDLFLNVIAWLAEEPDQIGERPEAGEILEITESGQALLCLASIGVVPGAALLVAVGVLLRRRSL
jgi:hypothetical protein